MCSKRARLFVVLIGFWIISTALVHLLDLGLHLLRLVLVLHAERLILNLLRMRTGSLLRLGRHVWRPEPESDHVSEAKQPLYRPQQQRFAASGAPSERSATGEGSRGTREKKRQMFLSVRTGIICRGMESNAGPQQWI